MKTKKWMAMLLTFGFIGSLTGCRLAREDADVNAGRDRLIGVYVTTEYVDLFDEDRYLEDNLNNIMKGGTTVLDMSAQGEYQNRLYAVLVDESSENMETGATVVRQKFVFEGLEGIAYYAPTMYESEIENTYISTESDEGISNSHTAVFSGDEERIELTGTIFVCPASGENVSVYCNPVYQTADGQVYLVTGSGISFDGGSGEGASMSTKLEDSVTITENGETKTYANSVEISVEIVYVPEKIVVLQMDGAGNLLESQEYVPGMLPEEIEPMKGTEYLVVETHKLDSAGQPKVSRELIDREEDNFKALYAREDNVCVYDWTQIHWGE